MYLITLAIFIFFPYKCMKDENYKRKMDEFVEKINSYEKYIYEFPRDERGSTFLPYEKEKRMPKENGIYLTIRCGYMGIYTMANLWENGDWQIQVLDGSFTIAYSQDKLKDLEEMSQSL